MTMRASTALAAQDGWPTLGGNVSSELDWELATAHDDGGNSSLGADSTLLPPAPSAPAGISVSAVATAGATPVEASLGRIGSLASSQGSDGATTITGRPHLAPPSSQQLPPHLHPIAAATAPQLHAAVAASNASSAA